jgi:hypothetical protein
MKMYSTPGETAMAMLYVVIAGSQVYSNISWSPVDFCIFYNIAHWMLPKALNASEGAPKRMIAFRAIISFKDTPPDRNVNHPKESLEKEDQALFPREWLNMSCNFFTLYYLLFIKIHARELRNSLCENWYKLKSGRFWSGTSHGLDQESTRCTSYWKDVSLQFGINLYSN